MQISLSFPAHWEVKHAPGNQHIAVLCGPDGKPRLIVTYGALTLLPDDQRAWTEQALLEDLPQGTRLSVGQAGDSETVAGWPLRVIEAQLLAPRSDDPIEERVYAFYAFMEHAAVVMVRALDKKHLEEHREAIRDLLQSGRPDWSTRGQPACLAELWSLERTRAARQQRRRGELSLPPLEAADQAQLSQELQQHDAALQTPPHADFHLTRGILLRRLERHEESLEAFRSAAALAPSAAAPLHWAGLSLTALGRESEAIAAWEAAVALDTNFADAYYDAAQALYKRKEFSRALGHWQKVVALDPADFLTHRKIIQCLYALNRVAEADAARVQLRELWHKSSDPRARIIHEYVFDQFQEGPLTIHAYETVHARDPRATALYTFRVIDEHDHPQPLLVTLETTGQVPPDGEPYVLVMTQHDHPKIIGKMSRLPPYAELKVMARKLFADATSAAE